MILLDTHIWIWQNTAPGMIPARLAQSLREEPETVISAVSVWEAMLLIDKGRLRVNVGSEDAVRTWLSGHSARVLPLEADAAILSRTLAFSHEDPADRFIAATAFHLGVPLATVDERLIALPWLKTV